MKKTDIVINKFSFYSIQGFVCPEFKDFVKNCDYLLSNKTYGKF